MVCVGLFVINYDFKPKNFREIHRFIRKNKLTWNLFSILIPFKGTRIHEEYKDELYKYNYKRTDGTKILMKPKYMWDWSFQLQFALLYYLNYPRTYLAWFLKTYDKRYKNKGQN